MNREWLVNMFGLQGKTAVVIGGGGVLGGEMCDGLAMAGAHVVVADVNEEQCRARAERICGQGGSASVATVDVTSKGSIEGLLAAALEVNGCVNVLVNAAGINHGTAFLEHGEEEWKRVLNVNLTGTFLATQVFAAHMAQAGGGSIINIGSVTSILPLSRVFGYSASKAGVLNLSRNAAQDLAPQKVRVNCICPGFFPAEQNRKLLTPERVESIMKGTPMNRYGEPSELVGALLLLASDTAGGFITGAAISVDGGFTSAWF